MSEGTESDAAAAAAAAATGTAAGKSGMSLGLGGRRPQTPNSFQFPDLVTPSETPGTRSLADSFHFESRPASQKDDNSAHTAAAAAALADAVNAATSTHSKTRSRNQDGADADDTDPETTRTRTPPSEETVANLRSALKPLPKVACTVRARIPTVAGYELYLHGYTNDYDTKEHLAIVIGPYIRSRSLDAPRPGETEMDRLIRGAYEGRLHPGRTTSKLAQSVTREDLEREASQDTYSANKTDDPKQTTDPSKIPLVRIHSECYTGETIGSSRCDCGDQLNDACAAIARHGSGVIVYLRQEGRGIGLFEKMKAYNLQDLGSDTLEANLLLHHPADARDYGIATSILIDLDCHHIDLLTNNPLKIAAVEGDKRQIVVRNRVEMVPRAWQGKDGVQGAEFDKYFATKIQRMGHMLSGRP
ncbi:GTP cyclohydrolase II [Savitreella phatthalungensis]